MKSVEKTGVIAVRLEPGVKKRAEAAAAGEGRSLSNWVRELIVDRLKAIGATRKPDKPS